MTDKYRSKRPFTSFDEGVLRVRRLARNKDTLGLIAELSSTHERSGLTVRPIAARHLGRTKDPVAVQPLVALLRKDDDPDVRMAAVYSLGAIGSDEATDALVKALTDTASIVRRAAANVLGTMRASQAVEPLVRMLDDKDRDIAYVAATALIAIGDSRALDGLREYARNERSLFRRRRMRSAIDRIERG